MKRLVIFLSSVILVTLVIPDLIRNPSPVLALTNPVTGTATVSATIPDLSFNPPTLLTPAVNATLNTVRPSFSWLRPSPLPTLSPLHHYDFYLDDSIFATAIPDSLITQNYYFYTASTSADIFHLSLKTDLTQGYHTWKVIAFTENGVSSSSQSRRFYIDSLPPFISVTKVDKHSLRWSTKEPNSIPPENSRYLTSSTANPFIKGHVERSSNIRIILICPPNIPNCHGGVFAGNIPSGIWETKFENLLPGIIYSVDIKATDASGNYTEFPIFYITYGRLPPETLLPSLSLPPITPPITEANIVIPTTYIPPAPTPPPTEATTQSVPSRGSVYPILLAIMIFGFLLHLLMASLGTSAPISFLLKFLLILGYPFLRQKRFRTIPFGFINIYIPNKIDHCWQSVVSDIHGNFDLKSPLPENMFIEISALGRKWKNILIRGTEFNTTCQIPPLTDPYNGSTRLRKAIYDTKIIPLTIALLTGSIALVIQPSFFIIIYLYLSIQYFYSEYIYPQK